jgi:hypothetical protein
MGFWTRLIRAWRIRAVAFLLALWDVSRLRRLDFFCLVSQPFRAGLMSFAPTALVLTFDL